MDRQPSTFEKIGRFKVVQRLTSSGPGDVFMAKDGDTHRDVVLKVLPAPPRNQGLLEPPLAREAAAYARLTHASVVKVVEIFSENGRTVIALEHVDGKPLNVFRAALKRAGEALDDRAAIYVAARIFAGLSAAHTARDEAGEPCPVLHRNIVPSNVLLGWEGQVKLANFSVANTAAVVRDSNPGFTWGSYGYLAPEQVRSEPLSAASDVYSATLLLWEMLAKRKAIERGALSDSEVLSAMATPDITSLDMIRPDLDGSVRDAIRLGLEPVVERRVVTAELMYGVLRGAIDLEEARAMLARALDRIRVVGATELAAAPKPPVPALRPAAPPAPIAGKAQPLAPMLDTQREVPVVQRAARGGLPVPNATREEELSSADLPMLAADLPAIAAPPAPAPTPASPPAAPPPTFVRAPVRSSFDPFPVPAPLPIVTASSGLALEPSPRPHRMGWIRVTLGAVLTVCFAVAVAAQVVRARSHAIAPPTPPIETAPPTSPPRASAAALPPSAAPEPPAPAAASAPLPPSVTASPSASAAEPATPASNIPADMCDLLTPKSAGGHRIFFDGRVVGESPRTVRVACGAHTIKIGSSGSAQALTLPCGADLTVEMR